MLRVFYGAGFPPDKVLEFLGLKASCSYSSTTLGLIVKDILIHSL